MRTDPTAEAQRLARINQMIAEYQAVKSRRLMERALNEWQDAEASQPLVDVEKPPRRVH